MSTTTAILQITDNLFTATDNNMMTSIMAIDQSAAFDCVNFEILLRKLKRYRCSQNTISWINSYLSDRSQYIAIGPHESRMVALHRGVPQGSILGAPPLCHLHK